MTEQQNPTNKFPGPCAKCSKPVTAKAGILRRDGKRFVVFHSACAEGQLQQPQQGASMHVPRRLRVMVVAPCSPMKVLTMTAESGSSAQAEWKTTKRLPSLRKVPALAATGR